MSGPPGAMVSIPERFNGPPESANGGFACGTLARAMGESAAEVSLRMPPPLAVSLEVASAIDGAELRHGADVIAEARPLSGLELTPPARVGAEQAAAASRRYPWFHNHLFPTCFVCGPDREHDDGLGLYAGPTGDASNLHAVPWVPDAEWDEGGQVREEIVWAALDCPSAVPVMRADAREAPAMLARLAGSLEAPVIAGRPHVVLSWVVEVDGRKLHSASAICDEHGEVLARASALWIELRR